MQSREEQTRRQAELADRAARAEEREGDLRRREEELKHEEAALISANLELQARPLCRGLLLQPFCHCASICC